MAPEVFANLAETTLASGYTSGGSSLSVASATLFPTTGVFRVALGNTAKTIFRVDSVSGTTFTGAAEAFDGNADSGQAVTLVASKAVAERFLQSPTAPELHAPTGLAGVTRYGPIWPVRGVVAAEFSWVNQGSATDTVTGGVARLVCPGQSQNIRARMKSFPSSDFTVTALVLPIMRTIADAEAGIIFREAGTDKWQAIRLAHDNIIYVSNWTAANAFAANQFTGAAAASSFAWSFAWALWLRVRYDGTNVVYSYSFDGVHWVQALSEAKTARFTTAPDQVGYFVNDRTGGVQQEMSVLSWLET